MKDFDAATARALAGDSNYTTIISAIERAARSGKRYLDLVYYSLDPDGGGWIKEWDYNDSDLERLKSKGFTITEQIDTYRKFIFWGKRESVPTGIHTVSW